jgi:glycosyltransferase involved in cell wall biosynthesis
MLSVCFSTYNRSELLQVMLSSLERECAATPDVITECVISVNGCDDDTAEAVARFALRLNRVGVVVRALISPTTLQWFASYNRAIRASTNPFVWLFSDDDVFTVGSVRAVSEMLNRYAGSVGMLSVNWQSVERDLRRPVGPPSISKKVEHLYSSFEDALFRISIWHFSFLCSLIVRRESWISSVSVIPEEYCAHQYAQLFVVNDMLATASVYVSSFVCVQNRLNYRDDQYARKPQSLVEGMSRGLSTAVSVYKGVEKSGLSRAALRTSRMAFASSPALPLQLAVARVAQSESNELFADIDEVFGDLWRYRAARFFSRIAPRVLVTFLVGHRDFLRTCHRTIAGMSRIWRSAAGT